MAAFWGSHDYDREREREARGLYGQQCMYPSHEHYRSQTAMSQAQMQAEAIRAREMMMAKAIDSVRAQELPTPKKKPKTYRDELQAETDKWLK